jgi:hypothetical protein
MLNNAVPPYSRPPGQVILARNQKAGQQGKQNYPKWDDGQVFPAGIKNLEGCFRGSRIEEGENKYV